MLEDHAQVKINDYKVPLIGIPKIGTVEKCDKCKLDFHLQEIELVDREFLCEKCKFIK